MKKIFFAFLAILFVALGAAVTLSIVNYQNQHANSEQDESESGFLKTSGEFKDKLANLKIKRDRAELQSGRLERRKKDAADKLRENGVRNVGDVQSDDRESRLLIAELQDIVKTQEELRSDIKIYDDAIVSIEAILRKFDRELVMSGAGNSRKQEEELRRIILNVDDRLTGDRSIVDELETQDLLDEILGDDAVGGDSSIDD